MLKKSINLMAVGAFLVLLLSAIAWQRINAYVDSPLPVDEPRTVLIERGQGFNQIVAELEAENLVQRPIFLRIYARLHGLAHQVKAGEYELEPGLTLRALLQKMIDGDTLRHFFTVVEGTTFAQLREQLEANTVLLQTLSELDDSEVMAQLGEPEKHPEGMFLAETYQYLRGMTDLDLLRRARASLDDALAQAWEKRESELPYDSAYEALTMASIIEKETAVPQERPRISGVFVRRLQQGMRLQTDPTVIYGMGAEYKGNLRRSDLLKKTPYNTYVIEGLPPTPIAMVGKDAIEAALNPETGPWLFFVAKGDGSHHFSAHLSEHNSAVRRYQLQRREDYRSTPEG
ncbi:endolytic transglycosylase MltG [Marinobacterium sedimentorum]|uniref:endolytic transglycosylase MltG n=1 Tax=Marinobacterium sedimentorum TaxID=2927804 RepID=UPI0020C5D978|nr:endolytic transglycosylase MltG [Marinobacterium sedimentorum]